MKTIRTSSVIEALADWGRHEAPGRGKGVVTLAKGDHAAAAEYAMKTRGSYIADILSRLPLGAHLIELTLPTRAASI